ncbi:MAG: hypothetical protein NHG36_20160 [Chromatiaceae bacterium]|jgi:hypothetical protein|nr:hypothetical protein [Candidatus Thioaporhodococcus sediminis]
MATKIYDVAVKTRSYQDPRTGEKKGVWQNVGAVWKGDDGNSWLTLNRWFNPAGIPTEEGRDSISCSLFPPKPQNGAP